MENVETQEIAGIVTDLSQEINNIRAKLLSVSAIATTLASQSNLSEEDVKRLIEKLGNPQEAPQNDVRSRAQKKLKEMFKLAKEAQRDR